MINRERVIKGLKTTKPPVLLGVLLLSGWQDSNLRPPAPKAGAITGLRYTPRCVKQLDLQNPSLFRATNISKVQPLARGGEKKTT